MQQATSNSFVSDSQHKSIEANKKCLQPKKKCGGVKRGKNWQPKMPNKLIGIENETQTKTIRMIDWLTD